MELIPNDVEFPPVFENALKSVWKLRELGSHHNLMRVFGIFTLTSKNIALSRRPVKECMFLIIQYVYLFSIPSKPFDKKVKNKKQNTDENILTFPGSLPILL